MVSNQSVYKQASRLFKNVNDKRESYQLKWKCHHTTFLLQVSLYTNNSMYLHYRYYFVLISFCLHHKLKFLYITTSIFIIWFYNKSASVLLLFVYFTFFIKLDVLVCLVSKNICRVLFHYLETYLLQKLCLKLDFYIPVFIKIYKIWYSVHVICQQTIAVSLFFYNDLQYFFQNDK